MTCPNCSSTETVVTDDLVIGTPPLTTEGGIHLAGVHLVVCGSCGVVYAPHLERYRLGRGEKVEAEPEPDAAVDTT